ncbi:MAG: carbohydrate kinase family protein [Candidatus Heimdallarchaeota archaeon]|nr:MAG: carbohydrate kinase family protein [Candidatus Heimdallarchaeota archaeon]
MAVEVVPKVEVDLKKEKPKVFDVLGLGEIVIDLLLKVPQFPRLDEKVYVTEREKQAGGVTANFSVGVSRQGLSVAFIGAVGEDEEGNFLRARLLQEGVDDRFLVTRDSKTPVNIVIITEKGEKAILQSEFMRVTLPPKELIQPSLIQAARHLHLTAINFETALKAVRLAKRYNLGVSLDLESQVVKDYSKDLPLLLEFVDFLLPNKQGASEFTQIQDPKNSSLKLLEYGPEVVIITLGEKGVLLTTQEKQELFPAFKVANVVDTTGAGDAFNAGFITGILKGNPIEQSIRRGQATAALKIQGMGAQEPLPTAKQLSKFLSL